MTADQGGVTVTGVDGQKAGGALERVRTGVAGLDRILSGGLIRGGVYIVEGSPGAGKTILANQMCFFRAKGGDRVCYLTLLSEGHDRMLDFLSPMSFCDVNVLPDRMTYVSGYASMREGGLNGVLDLLSETIRRTKPHFFVLDGLYIAQEAVHSDTEFREFIYALQGEAALHRCTVALLTNGPRPAYSPERTMVDGIIQLTDTAVGQRSARTLRVLKFRGSAFLGGEHIFRIDDDGVTVLPRLESITQAETAERPKGCLSTGVPGLDAMTGGGVVIGSTTLLLGPSGIGKTTFGLHFLSQVTPQAPGLLFGCYETPARLVAKGMAVGIDIAGLVASGALEVLWHRPFESSLDELADDLLAAVRRVGARRVFIDGVGAFEQTALRPDRLNAYFGALALSLQTEGATTMLSSVSRDVLSVENIALDDLSVVAENVLLLRYRERGERMERRLSILKLRDNGFDPSVRRFDITSRGIMIEQPSEGVGPGRHPSNSDSG